jgi:hypothetical protein
LEPIGDERDDLRIGALASVIYNMNLDTRKTGVIKSYRYVTGWGNDKVHMLALEPNAEDAKAANQGSGYGPGSGSGSDCTLNNPIVWENFKAGLKKVYGARKANG